MNDYFICFKFDFVYKYFNSFLIILSYLNRLNKQEDINYIKNIINFSISNFSKYKMFKYIYENINIIK